jgi:hypothetical protein
VIQPLFFNGVRQPYHYQQNGGRQKKRITDKIKGTDRDELQYIHIDDLRLDHWLVPPPVARPIYGVIGRELYFDYADVMVNKISVRSMIL